MFLYHHLVRELVNAPNYFIPKNENKVSIVTSRLIDNAFYLFDYLVKDGQFDVNYLFVKTYYTDMKRVNQVLKKIREEYGITPYLLKSKKGLKEYYRSGWIFSDSFISMLKPLKHQIKVQLWHGYIGKRLGYANPIKRDIDTLFKWTTSIFTTPSSFLRLQFMAEFNLPWEKFILAPSPRFDRIINMRKRAKELLKGMGIDITYKYLILAAPTFRKDRHDIIDIKKSYNIISSYLSESLRKFLVEEDILLIIKPHPFLTFEKSMLESKDNIMIIDDSVLSQNLIGISDILPAFDLLITDYSSVFVDYLLINKPIIFFVPDYFEINNILGYTVTFDRYSPGPKVYNVKDLINAIQDALLYKIDNYINKRICIRDILIEKWYPENNTKRLVKTLGLL